MCIHLKEKVLIGMSGGVDSSVAAALLLEQGYDVTGVTFRLCPDETGAGARDAARVADALGIPHKTVDFTELFRTQIMDYFVSEYLNGRTPNPCVQCNRKIKFGRFLALADEWGADYIATGHYARIEYNPERRLYSLCIAGAKNKDQSYFLYTLTQKELGRTLMPLAGLEKDHVRTLAKQYRLPVAEKSDSQDVCFIPDGDYVRFLKEYAQYEDKKGVFCSQDGTVLGEHSGIARFTIGQRKGLGTAFGKPMFVTGLDAKNHIVYLGEKGTEFTQEFTASDFHAMDQEAFSAPCALTCKIRYRAPFAACSVTLLGEGKIRVLMREPARAVTPGQSVVFYVGDRVAGGAVIDNMY